MPIRNSHLMPRPAWKHLVDPQYWDLGSNFSHRAKSVHFPLVTRKGRNSEPGDVVVNFLVFQEWSDKWPNLSFFLTVHFT